MKKKEKLQAIKNALDVHHGLKEPSLQEFIYKRRKFLEMQNIMRASMPPNFVTVKPFDKLTGTFKHSGDLGDLWYSLPVVRYLGGGKIYLKSYGLQGKKCDGTMTGFTLEMIEMCKPLLEAQPYITECNHYQQIVKDILDLDLFRKVKRPEKLLCHKILGTFCVPLTELDQPWITCEPKKIAPVVFARSFRFRNTNYEYAELLNLHKDAVFIGLKEEHQDFVKRFGKISHYPIKNFLEMAEVISGAELFIGNQSSPMALAISMHKPFIQEVSPIIPDCQFNRDNAKYMNKNKG